jgi:hypothetical protein
LVGEARMSLRSISILNRGVSPITSAVKSTRQARGDVLINPEQHEITDYIHEGSAFDLIPAHEGLANLEKELISEGVRLKEYQLLRAIKPIVDTRAELEHNNKPVMSFDIRERRFSNLHGTNNRRCSNTPSGMIPGCISMQKICLTSSKRLQPSWNEALLRQHRRSRHRMDKQDRYSGAVDFDDESMELPDDEGDEPDHADAIAEQDTEEHIELSDTSQSDESHTTAIGADTAVERLKPPLTLRRYNKQTLATRVIASNMLH